MCARPAAGQGAAAPGPVTSLSTVHRSTVAVLAIAAALPAQSPAVGLPPHPPAAFDLDAAFAAALPPLAEALWTQIPWRHSLTDALAEAARTQRPVYLFANDGDVASGRC